MSKKGKRSITGTSERDELRNKVFWAVTALHSLLSTCNRLNTAASCEKDKRLRGFGYNGSLPGQPHCDDAGHLIIEGHCERTNHCEDNLDLNTDPKNMKDSTVRIIATPCLRCVRRNLLARGVAEIRFTGRYSHVRGEDIIDEFCQQSGAALVHEDIDWAELFQQLFDLMTKPGGIFFREGYELRITKEPLSKGKSQK